MSLGVSGTAVRLQSVDGRWPAIASSPSSLSVVGRRSSSFAVRRRSSLLSCGRVVVVAVVVVVGGGGGGRLLVGGGWCVILVTSGWLGVVVSAVSIFNCGLDDWIRWVEDEARWLEGI